jgi:hypothetical protein
MCSEDWHTVVGDDMPDLPVYDGLIDPFCPIHGEPVGAPGDQETP